MASPMDTDDFQLDDVGADAPEMEDPSDAFADPGLPAVRARPGMIEQFIGVIRSGPCSGKDADYSDERYFIDRAVPDPSLSTSDSFDAKTDRLPGVKQCITATNLAELDDSTHLLDEGTLVQVFALYSRGKNTSKLHVFNHPPTPSAVVVKITAAAGAGEYSGRILAGGSSVAPGSLAMPAGLSLPAADDALVLNVEEDGLTGNRLSVGSYAVGVVRGTSNETPPRKIIFIRGGVGRGDSPATLGSAAEGSETADSASWSRATSGAPVDVFVVTRTVYNESGDKTLYQFFRRLSFDARGLLSAVGPETRVVVDVTEPCS